MTTQKCIANQTLKMENGRKNMDDFPSETWQMDNVLNVIILRNNNYSNLVTKDNIDSLTVNGQAYIRYVNAIPDSSKPKVTINAGGKDVINEQAAFTNASDFVPVNAGNVTININNGGNIQAGRIISVEASKIYTVLLTGLPDAKDSAQSVQIKYIENGTVSGSTARKTVSSSSVSISK